MGSSFPEIEIYPSSEPMEGRCAAYSVRLNRTVGYYKQSTMSMMPFHMVATWAKSSLHGQILRLVSTSTPHPDAKLLFTVSSGAN